jgi:hypothetical protein
METKTENNSPRFEQWAKVELMGRQVIVGMVTETTIAGGSFLRVDVPKADGTVSHSRFYSTAAIYCISPVSQEVAVALIARYDERPVQAYELPERSGFGPGDEGGEEEE